MYVYVYYVYVCIYRYNTRKACIYYTLTEYWITHTTHEDLAQFAFL